MKACVASFRWSLSLSNITRAALSPLPKKGAARARATGGVAGAARESHLRSQLGWHVVGLRRDTNEPPRARAGVHEENARREQAGARDAARRASETNARRRSLGPRARRGTRARDGASPPPGATPSARRARRGAARTAGFAAPSAGAGGRICFQSSALATPGWLSSRNFVTNSAAAASGMLSSASALSSGSRSTVLSARSLSTICAPCSSLAAASVPAAAPIAPETRARAAPRSPHARSARPTIRDPHAPRRTRPMDSGRAAELARCGPALSLVSPRGPVVKMT